MTHGLEKRSPSLPLGIDVQTVYTTLADGSNRVTVVLRNNTLDWLEIKKGVPIARMVATNEVPKVTNLFSAEQTKEQSTLTEAERQDLLLEKLDLSGLEVWPEDQAGKAHSLLKEYHDIFSLEKCDMGHTDATKHKIVLKDLDTLPFKEHFCRIPPPQLDEVREHLKLMLDTGVIRPSNSPWCNAVVLVRKKDGSLHFCIDFRKLNSLTVKDSHLLPRICETLESLAGAAHYSMFDMNSAFWQVPMDEESKQYTAFTLGSMGLYECESMPFGLCNAPPTFQRLMQNCLDELNLTYCLIYLDDVIVFSNTPEEHLGRMHVVFDRLREHGLKLKPSKCDVFKSEINYLAHHVSRRGVLPSKKNLESIAQCPPLDTYTKMKSFVGLVGHYRHFIKGFAKIAAPLYDLTSGDNKDKKSEHVDLSPEAREAFDRLKATCLQAPILAFPDFNKPFLLETDASGRGLGAVLSQKQADGRYHPIAYASRVMNETEQRYHSNNQEFLALKWAVTEQFHEYLSPYGKNRNKFVVHTDNNPLTYIFSSANLDAAGQQWVAHLASYNFSLEYQKGKDNMVADFLSQMNEHLPEEEVQEYLNQIPYPGVKAVLNNAITPIEEHAEQGVRPTPDCQGDSQEETIVARPTRLATTNVTDWKQEQKEDPVLYQVAKHLRARETFKAALHKVLDKKATATYVKAKEQLLIKNGLLYRKTRQGQADETVFQFVAFDRLKATCLQAPILAFPDFNKPFLLETDASGRGLGAVLSQKQADGRYHPIAYASRVMNETEQRYHSNNQEFLALKWAVTEQFHEYLSPYGKNLNKFVVHTDNNPLTYIFSSANLDAAGQQWVAHLASYNFSLEYQKGKDNMVADFLSQMNEHLPEEEVQEYLNQIPYPGVKAVLDNAITPIEEHAEQGVRPTPDCQGDSQEETIVARPTRLATTNVTDWKQEQEEDPVLYQVAKHLRARETFKAALHKVLDKKATATYVKAKEQLLIKNGLLYRKTRQGQADETVFQFVVPQRHRGTALDGCHREAAHQGQHRSTALMQECFWWPGMTRDLRNRIKNVVAAGNMRLLHQWCL